LFIFIIGSGKKGSRPGSSRSKSPKDKDKKTRDKSGSPKRGSGKKSDTGSAKKSSRSKLLHRLLLLLQMRGHCDFMVVGFITTYAISVPFTTNAVSSNPGQARCTRYNIM
jgi:hypothetical protein